MHDVVVRSADNQKNMTMQGWSCIGTRHHYAAAAYSKNSRDTGENLEHSMILRIVSGQ